MNVVRHSYHRLEAVGFALLVVDYEVKAVRAENEVGESMWDLTELVRIDPITADHEVLPYTDWPLTDLEEAAIHDWMLGEYEQALG